MRSSLISQLRSILREQLALSLFFLWLPFFIRSSRRVSSALLPSQAQEYLLRVLRLQPDNKEAWEDLGQCYLETGDLEKSLEAYRRAVALVKGSDDSSSAGGK